ncbi:MAG: dicarboxylate/amino acid:cation symporter [Deltaproteobacteria bacterium]|nr:dicarboxylate/amino acid:cation symporter [Deltaproteobacteria bacterium]
MNNKKLQLWHKILIGLVLGLIAGIIVGPGITVLKPFGTLFINLLKMMIVPLLVLFLVAGAASITDIKKLGRVGGKIVGMYLLTTFIAVSIGIVFALIIQPGTGVEIEKPAEVKGKEAPSIVSWLVDIVPKNVIKAMSESRVLQIIFFSLFLGICLALVGEPAKPVIEIFEILSQAMVKMVHIVMEYAPYAVFALMAWVAGKYGLKMMLPLGKLIITVYLACAIHIIVVYGFIVKVLGKRPLGWFFKGGANAMAVAYSTASSAATLPATMECSEKNHGVSKTVFGFSLPLGATINMDGTSTYQAICAIFTAQLFGIDLSLYHYMAIILTGTLASIGAAGVPGAGLIMLTMVLTAAGLPLEAIGIIAGVDRIMDMFRTMTNVTGDMAVTLAVAHTEGELEELAESAAS